MDDTFPAKVAALHETWLTRRRTKYLSNRRDLTSRFRLLLVLYDWTRRAIEAIAQVYGESLSIELTPPPDLATDQLSFAVTLDGEYRLSFAIYQRDQAARQWEFDVQVSTPDSILSVGRSRGAGQWMPRRVEEALLSLLMAIERARFDAYQSADGPLRFQEPRQKPGSRGGATAAGL